MTSDKKTISLVLGSGGARGHAHIGVIRAVEEHGLAIANIAGCSMGSVIGGIYAADRLDTYVEWANALTRRDVIRLLDLSFTVTSLFKGERIFNVLEDLIGQCNIEELDCGFTAVATDIDAQREVWLNHGPLFRAIRASTSVPGVFSPVEINGRTLVDGGLVNPVPIAPTLNDASDFTVAVNLNSLTDDYERPQTEDQRSDADQGYREKISQFLTDLLDSDNAEDESPDAAELLTRSIDVMQGAIARLKLAAYAPDMTVDIPRNACTFFEFHRAREMAELGYRKTCEALGELKL